MKEGTGYEGKIRRQGLKFGSIFSKIGNSSNNDKQSRNKAYPIPVIQKSDLHASSFAVLFPLRLSPSY